MYVCMYVCNMCLMLCMCVCVCVCMYVCMYVYMYACMHAVFVCYVMLCIYLLNTLFQPWMVLAFLGKYHNLLPGPLPFLFVITTCSLILSCSSFDVVTIRSAATQNTVLDRAHKAYCLVAQIFLPACLVNVTFSQYKFIVQQ